VILQINSYPIAQAGQVGQVMEYLRARGPVRVYFARGDQVIYADLWGTP